MGYLQVNVAHSLYQVLPGQDLFFPGHQRKHKNNG